MQFVEFMFGINFFFKLPIMGGGGQPLYSPLDLPLIHTYTHTHTYIHIYIHTQIDTNIHRTVSMADW